MIVYNGWLMVIWQLLIYAPNAYCSCPNNDGIMYKVMLKKQLKDNTVCSLYETVDFFQEPQCAILCKSENKCSYFTATDSDRCGMCMVSGFDPTNTGLTVSGHIVGDDAVVYNTGRRYTSRYEILITGPTFDTAKSACEAEGGNLASLKSESERQDIITVISEASNPCSYYWISGCRDENSVWRWGDGDTGGVWIWAPNEPTNVEDCVLVNYQGKLFDVLVESGYNCNICHIIMQL